MYTWRGAFPVHRLSYRPVGDTDERGEFKTNIYNEAAHGKLHRGPTEFIKTNSKLRYSILCGHFHYAQINGRDFEGGRSVNTAKMQGGKVVALIMHGTSMKTAPFYFASLWRYCHLIV